jgi:hypothetical protein
LKRQAFDDRYRFVSPEKSLIFSFYGLTMKPHEKRQAKLLSFFTESG